MTIMLTATIRTKKTKKQTDIKVYTQTSKHFIKLFLFVADPQQWLSF